MSSEVSEGPFSEEKYHLCSNGALVISWALCDVTRLGPHCLPTSCRFLRLISTSCLICPSGFFTRATPRVDFKETSRTPHFPTRMSHSGLLCAAGMPGKRGPVFPPAARSAIAHQSHGNKAEGSAGPRSSDLTRFVIPVRPDPNYDIPFQKKMAGFTLHARALNWAGVELSASANKEMNRTKSCQFSTHGPETVWTITQAMAPLSPTNNHSWKLPPAFALLS